MATTVINIHALVPGAVYIGRPGHGESGYFGNPFHLTAKEPRGSTLERFREYAEARIYSDPEYRANVRSLRGRTLACFCKPAPCHGDILAELAEQDL